MKIVTLMIVALVFAGVPAYALDAPIDEGLAKAADSKSYGVKVPGMAMYGVYEIAEAPFEPLHRPYEQTVEKGDHAFGALRGINRGTYNVLEGFTSGIFNVVRSLVPGMGRYENKNHQAKLIPDRAE